MPDIHILDTDSHVDWTRALTYCELSAVGREIVTKREVCDIDAGVDKGALCVECIKGAFDTAAES